MPWFCQVHPVLVCALVTLGLLVAPFIAQAQQLNLSWIDNSGGQAGFIIQRALGNTGAYIQIAQVPPGIQSYSDTSVSLGTTYCYQVAAANSSGTSPFSNVACGNPSGGFTVAAVKSGNGVGTVTSSPAGIDCGSTCSYTYLAGRAVTLTATPSSGSGFTGWSGGGCGGTDVCTIAGNGSTTVTATFSTAAAIAVSSVTPNRGTAGATVPVTINGSGFAGGATVTVSGTGVTASNVTIVSATQLTATLTVASGANQGTRDVTVTTSGGGNGTLAGGFTVGSAAPATLTVAYNGTLQDRVGQGHLALSGDGAPDGTLTVALNASGGRTITYLRLDSRKATGELVGVWDTNSGDPVYWALGTAPSLDGALVNNPGDMTVNFPVANGASFVLFAADFNGIEFLPGNTLTVTATFSDGTTAAATTTGASAGPASLTVAYNGMLRDRVGQGHLALSGDGAPDGTLTVALNASGGRTITYLRLDSRKATGELVGVWDTNSGDPAYWALGTAPSLDGALVNNPGDMTVNFPVANGASFVLFAADFNGIEFLPENTLTVTATFSDGTTAAATTTGASAGPAFLTVAYKGTLRDRVGQGHLALSGDGALDGTLTVVLNASGGRTITYLRLDSRKATGELVGVWDTNSGDPVYWALGTAPSLDGALVNNPGDMTVNFPVANGASFVLFAADFNGIEFLPGNTLTVTATFADGSSASATRSLNP